MTLVTSPSAPRGKTYDNVLQTVAGTPLVRINKMAQEAGCVGIVLAKLEFFNPLSSVKDRTALALIESAESAGTLKEGSIIVESTSGNTGIGLAFVASVKGYDLILTMPENMSAERQKLLRFLGATIELTPAADGMMGAGKRAEEIVAQNPHAVMLRQFDNPANPEVHGLTTAPEIWADTDGKVDAFVAGVGTGGTVQGTGTWLKQKNPDIKIVAVEPAQSPLLSAGTAAVHGIQGIGANFVPSILNQGALDEIITVTDERAIECARDLARKEGIAAGISSGAAVAAAMVLAKRPEMTGKVIVTLLPDSAERYLSTALFE